MWPGLTRWRSHAAWRNNARLMQHRGRQISVAQGLRQMRSDWMPWRRRQSVHVQSVANKISGENPEAELSKVEINVMVGLCQKGDPWRQRARQRHVRYPPDPGKATKAAIAVLAPEVAELAWTRAFPVRPAMHRRNFGVHRKAVWGQSSSHPPAIVAQGRWHSRRQVPALVRTEEASGTATVRIALPSA